MTNNWSSPVTDAMVERAWAAIVGRDIAPQCFNASIIRGDLRTALEAVIGPAETATREALEEINALISNGDRPTVNERNAFEHFTTLNRLLLNIRDIARRALSLVPSTTRGACHDHPTKRCTPDDCCQPVTL